MNEGMKTVVYPVSDIAKAKALFAKLLGVEPYADQPYYIGFRIGEQEIGLDPNGHRHGMTGYWHVDDIRSYLQTLVEAGATVLEDVRDVGGGRLIATAKDADGNLIGLLQP